MEDLNTRACFDSRPGTYAVPNFPPIKFCNLVSDKFGFPGKSYIHLWWTAGHGHTSS